MLFQVFMHSTLQIIRKMLTGGVPFQKLTRHGLAMEFANPPDCYELPADKQDKFSKQCKDLISKMLTRYRVELSFS